MSLFPKLTKGNVRNILFIGFIFLLTTACTGIRVSDGRSIVTAEKEKPFCDIKKVDTNCKVEGKAQ